MIRWSEACRSKTDLSGTVHALTANLEAELARRGAGDRAKDRGDGDRGRRVASHFLAEAVGRLRAQPAVPGGAERTLSTGHRLEFLRQSRSGVSRRRSGSPVRSHGGQPPRRRREARSGDLPCRPRAASRDARRQPCSSAIPCAATARARGASAWASSGSRREMCRPPKLRRPAEPPIIAAVTELGDLTTILI